MSRRNQGEMQNESGLADILSGVYLVVNFDFIINLELIWLVMLQEGKEHRWLRAPARLLMTEVLA